MQHPEAYGLSVLRADERLPVWQHTDQQQRVVSARDLHSYLQVPRDFTNWVKYKIGQHRFKVGVDYAMLAPDKVFAKSGENSKGGRPRTEYVFSLEAAKIVAMGTNNAIGDEIKRYFLECEKIALSPKRPAVPPQKLLEHTFAHTQVNNSKVAQRFLSRYGANAVISYHRDTYQQHLGVSGAEIKAIGRRAGLKGPDLANGRAVLRKLEPSLACALSLQDHLLMFGVPKSEAIAIAHDSHELFDRIIQTGHFDPVELRPATPKRRR